VPCTPACRRRVLLRQAHGALDQAAHQAEVEQHHALVDAHYVVRLQISMQHAGAVQRWDARRQLQERRADPRQRELGARVVLGQPAWQHA